MKQPVDLILPPVPAGQRVPYWRLVPRGASQLCFQSNELTGLFFFAAVLVASPLAFAYFLVASILAPGGRILMGDRGPAVAAGLPGLNPSLIALSLPAIYQTGWTNVGMWLVLVACIASTVILTKLLVTILPFPILVLPYLITHWALGALAPHLDVLQPIATQLGGHLAFHPVGVVLLSLGQVVFSASPWSGLLFAAGVLLSNWRHGLVALFAAVVSALAAYYSYDVVAANVDLGLYGLNGVLTGVAVFLLCGGKFRLAILSAVVAVLLVPAVTALGVPALTIPFVLTTWLMLALGWVEKRWFDLPPADDSASPAA